MLRHKQSNENSEELGSLQSTEAMDREKGKAWESKWNPWETTDL